MTPVPPPRPAPPVTRGAVVAVAAAAAVTGVALAGVFALKHRTGRPAAAFTRDVAAVAGAPAYVGFVSQLTGLTWAAAAGAGLAGALNAAAAPGRRRFAAGLGVMSGALAADDALMLHEALLPAVGVPETLTLAAHAALAAAVFAANRAAAGRSEWPVLAAAGAALGASVALDQLNLGGSAAEDAAKLFGACAWCGYVALAAARPAA